MSVRFKHGLTLPRCPDGEFRQRVFLSSSDLRRGAEGSVFVSPRAVFTWSEADDWQQEPVEDFSVSLALVDKAGKEWTLKPKKGWKDSGRGKRGRIELPAVDDGDYHLRAKIKSSLGPAQVEMPLPLYAPARIHVMTDRPLYEPGNTVKFRAVVLRANDLSPIDNRPGTWVVRDPKGETLLEEKISAAEWGVVSGSFPLDSAAEQGRWTVAWKSGSDEGAQGFSVKPFTLPRFTVEASSRAPFYQAGESPELSGSVTYSSGAPVAGASLEIRWQASGDWPPPAQWLASELPKAASSDATGRFKLALPDVPADLRGQATLTANIAAVDPAGDRVEAKASILLSKDAIGVSAVTEFDGKLVASANNRLFLRVTSADGKPLPGASINVKKAWAPRDAGIDATLDEDGVARVQIDPGKPVTVVIPPMPVRAPPKEHKEAVEIVSGQDLLRSEDISLDDSTLIYRWPKVLAPCTRWVDEEEQNKQLSFQVAASGQIVGVAADGDRLGRCASAIVRRQRLSAGSPRILTLNVKFREPNLPSLDAVVTSARDAGDGVGEALGPVLVAARACLPIAFDGELPWRMSYSLTRKQKAIRFAWIAGAGKGVMPAGAAACIQRSVAGTALDEPSDSDDIGVVTFTITQPETEQDQQQVKPKPRTMRGYELLVSAKVGDKELGTTKLRLSPGTIPNMRLRTSAVLAKAGEVVDIELLRGPDYKGKLPKKIEVRHRGDRDELDVDREKRVASYQLPKDGVGWYEFVWGDVRTLVYVDDPGELEVSVKPDKPRYAPGSQATLSLATALGGKGAKAAVGLFGVDSTLAQLAPLPGADAMAELRPQVTMLANAFGVLDGQALVMGRIRGKAAAEAVVQRVGTIPVPDEIDVAVSSSAESPFDPVAELTTRFYDVLAELHSQTRQWEAHAKAGELMKPKTMAKLWNRALDAVDKRGGNVADAFGRRMRLHRLPEDLLSLTDPMSVVTEGTRLPEDVENWSEWVERKRP